MLSSGAINLTKNQLKFPVKPVYYGLLIIGIVLRLISYFSVHSLFLDESSIALNVTDRNFAGLLHPLDYVQIAPVLFLYIEKTSIILFGNSEHSLRLFPLICGLLSLPLIYSFTKTISGNAIAALVSLFLFATSTILIDYSNEVKQYESDVFSALCLLNLVVSPAFVSNENKRYILLAIVGSVLIFLSNVMVFVMVTVGVYYLFKYRLAIFKMWSLLVAFVCWVISALLYYYLFVVHNPVRAGMELTWRNQFMPFQVFSARFWIWLYEAILSLFKFYSLPFLPVFILSVIIFIIKKQKLFLFLLLFPLALHLIISGFKLYPFETRLTLYITAFITPAMSIGLVELVQAIKNRIALYIAVILLMVLVYSLVAQLVNTHYPFRKEEITNSIDYINSNETARQKIYVYYGAKRAVNYYLRINRISFKNDLVWGTEDWDCYNRDNCFNDLNKLNGKVWLLFSHVYPGDEEYTINRLAQSNDIVLKTFKTTGSSVYLVNLKPR